MGSPFAAAVLVTGTLWCGLKEIVIELRCVYGACADHLPEARAARLTLVDQGRRLLEQDWNLFRHVNENMNGVIGVGSDVGDADPMYHWGALAGFMSFEERHIY